MIAALSILISCGPAADSAAVTLRAQYDTAPVVTKTPVPTPTPEPTPTPVPLRENEVSAFSGKIVEADYVFLCEITHDIGVVNIAENASPLSKNTYISEHQYVVQIIQTIKDGEIALEEEAQVLLSIPYKYGVTSSKNDLMNQPGYIELAMGGRYLMFAEYVRNFELFSPCEGLSAFLIDGEGLYPKTSDDEALSDWERLTAETRAEMRSLYAAAEALAEDVK